MYGQQFDLSSWKLFIQRNAKIAFKQGKQTETIAAVQTMQRLQISERYILVSSTDQFSSLVSLCVRSFSVLPSQHFSHFHFTAGTVFTRHGIFQRATLSWPTWQDISIHIHFTQNSNRSATPWVAIPNIYNIPITRVHPNYAFPQMNNLDEKFQLFDNR